MTPEALAALHRLCFEGAPRPWTAAEFAALLSDRSAVLVTGPDGFALGRVAGDEAELLTLAVDPGRRRLGTARALVAALEAQVSARGAREMFLEVAETNTGARALYAGLGYAKAGRRPRYYGPGIDALILKKILTGAASGD